MINIIKNPYLFALILFFSCSVSAANRLIFSLDVIRHGDRTSFEDLPNAKHSWQEGLGQLTAIGMKQEYELGLKLHQRYIENHALLPKNYEAGAVYVQSTDFDRTIMSATSLLMGLYPLGTGPILSDSTPALPSQFQPIPIHTVPNTKDSVFLVDLSSSETAELIEKYVFTRADWKEKSLQLEPHYNRWSQLTGLNITSLWDVVMLGDTLTTYLAHDIPFPEGLSKEEAYTIMKDGQWLFATFFKPTQIGDAVGKQPLRKVIEYVQKAAEKTSKTKFVLISAHDSTLLAIMSALHKPLQSTPPYASNLNFSLYQNDLEHYFVTISFNEELIGVPGCQGKLCTLEQFLKL
ncbi:histidine phosphatase family protein [Legionella sp. km772]|uniref:histidine phosphatase family protein n=1 Tax=Legionella sp. km772 TaxID=2498111 RepID=UPI000F8CB201|nr:histidine phosphatase family protein [Legionella sp. km772]RUR07803.1 histidine-type phosphatase [Legionella sp. km772]